MTFLHSLKTNFHIRRDTVYGTYPPLQMYVDVTSGRPNRPELTLVYFLSN